MRSKNLLIALISLVLFAAVVIAQEIEQVGFIELNEQMVITARDNLVYVNVDQRNLRIYDVSDPENPDMIGETGNLGGNAIGVCLSGNYAYLANNQNGLYIIDISDPENPEQVGRFAPQRNVWDVFVSGQFAYLANSSDGLRILDISDPENPDLLSTLDTYEAYGVCAAGDYAYIADDREGLRVIDSSDPENPHLVGTCGDMEIAWRVAVSGNYAYVADFRNSEISVVDISDPENPAETGSCDTNGDPRGIWLVDNYLFAATMQGDRNGGLSIVDVSDPENPDEIAYRDVNVRCQSVSVSGNYAYLSTIVEGIYIFDVTDFVHHGPIIEISDEELDFEEVGLGLTGELPLTIANGGNENLNVSDISIEGDYFSSDFEDGFTLEPEEDREITVMFSPEELGEFEGSLTITSNDEENGEVQVALLGEGVGPVFYVHPRLLDFNSVGIDSSETKTLSIRNRGLNDLVISQITNQSEYFVTDFEDELTLEPDARHTLTVTFTPTDGIAYADTLVFVTNDPDNETVTVPMSGRGMGAVIAAEPDTVQFGEVGRNRSAERAVSICNEGEVNLDISEIFVEGRYFSIDLDSIYVVEPEGSLRCTVTFAPEEIGDFRANLFITSNDRQNEEFIVPLYGTGKGPEIAVDSDSLDFGLLRVGENTQLTLTISAVGLTDLTITDVTVQGAPIFLSAIEDEVFIELNNSFELPVSFNPSDDGYLYGVITIHSDDPENGELEIPLTGCAHRGVMIDTLGTISDLTVVGDLAYLVVQNGLVVLDVSNPVAPAIAGTYYNEGLNALSIFLNGNYAYIATGEDGFMIVDISVVDSTQFVSTYNTDGYVHSIAVRDGYAFVADGENGLRVIDLYEPESPFEVNYVDTPGEAYAVTLDGDYAYVADYVQGLRIIDISDPQEPSEIGYFNTRGMSMDVAVSEGLAYIADERYGLRIIDVTDHENPEEIGFYDTDGYAYGVDIAGDHAYIADGSGGMCMLDVSIPTSPYPAKIFYTPGLATSVEALDNYAFIADHGDILIIDVSEFLRVDELTKLEITTSYILKPAFPNPFNAVTSIRYGLPYSSHVTISIYDVSGRLIEELYNGYSTAGFQTVNWNAEGFKSGVYLVRLNTSSGFSTVQKLMLIR
ncbi:choice-of-anchor D domain-containing protein [bacterium]|nr:choice-of-anchor D domain-containing protein [bacterium]